MGTKSRISRFMALGCVIIASMGCSGNRNAGSDTDDGDLKRIYVEEVSSEGNLSTKETLEVMIKGNLPSSAYNFERFQVNVKGNIIEIIPLANYDSTQIAAQMLVPFEETCQVEPLKSGKYAIKVYGLNNEVKNDTVKVDESQ